MDLSKLFSPHKSQPDAGTCPPPRSLHGSLWVAEMVNESSRDNGESTRITESMISMPATLPSTVGVCARLVSKVQAYHFITWYRRREDCPRGAKQGHAGHIPARALAARPLQAPRAWSWRFDCRQRRRLVATSGTEKSAGRVVGEGALSPSGDSIGLRVKCIVPSKAKGPTPLPRGVRAGSGGTPDPQSDPI